MGEESTSTAIVRLSGVSSGWRRSSASSLEVLSRSFQLIRYIPGCERSHTWRKESSSGTVQVIICVAEYGSGVTPVVVSASRTTVPSGRRTSSSLGSSGVGAASSGLPRPRYEQHSAMTPWVRRAAISR